MMCRGPPARPHGFRGAQHPAHNTPSPPHPNTAPDFSHRGLARRVLPGASPNCLASIITEGSTSHRESEHVKEILRSCTTDHRQERERVHDEACCLLVSFSHCRGRNERERCQRAGHVRLQVHRIHSSRLNPHEVTRTYACVKKRGLGTRHT